VSLSARTANGENLARTAIRRFVARDESARVDVVIEPGALIESCQIYRNAAPESTGDAYSMEFEWEGRRLRCALVQFQARTQTAVPASVADTPAARDAVPA